MGIDFSHCDAHWAYSGFNRFRARLAKQIGINLDSMIGFGGNHSWESVSDPIKPFLNHSDCDGNLTVDECWAVAPRIQQLISDWKDDDYDKIHALELIEGMKNAVASLEPLEFK